MVATHPVSRLLSAPFKNYSPADIKSMRAKIGMSQSEFGQFFFSPQSTVKCWESGRRTPSCSAMRLLQIVEILANDKHRDFNHRVRQAYR